VQSQKFIEKVNTRTRQIFEQLDAETQSLDRREEQALHQLENSVDRFRNMYKMYLFF
jgi:F0F1-type ATP synthase membrane subunit b/b'